MLLTTLFTTLSTFAHAELATRTFARASGLREGEYRLRPGAPAGCAEGTLRIELNEEDAVDLTLGNRTLAGDVGAERAWTDADGCARTSHSVIHFGEIDVIETNSCGGARELLLLVTPGGIQYRAHQGGRVVTCALTRR